MTISQEKLDEMLAGLEGVTPGPWFMYGEYEVGLPSDVFAGNAMEGMGPVWGGVNLHHIARCDPDTIRSLITELKALRAQEPVAVKGLEWLSDKIPFSAYTPFCYYRIEAVDDDTGPHWQTTIRYQGSSYQRHQTEAEAKAAAQTDFAQRVLSCLASPTLSTVSPAVTDAVRDIDEEDLASDDRWNAGVNYAIERLCEIVEVDAKSISWDAATETLDGDVMSVICNVLVAAYGEEWSGNARETSIIRAALQPGGK